MLIADRNQIVGTGFLPKTSLTRQKRLGAGRPATIKAAGEPAALTELGAATHARGSPRRAAIGAPLSRAYSEQRFEPVDAIITSDEEADMPRDPGRESRYLGEAPPSNLRFEGCVRSSASGSLVGPTR